MDKAKVCIEYIKKRTEELNQRGEKWEKTGAISFAMGWFEREEQVPCEVLKFIMECEDIT